MESEPDYELSFDSDSFLLHEEVVAGDNVLHSLPAHRTTEKYAIQLTDHRQ